MHIYTYIYIYRRLPGTEEVQVKRTNRQTDGRKDRHTDRQKDNQTDRQTDRQTYKYRRGSFLKRRRWR
jgi:hypothetical protein